MDPFVVSIGGLGSQDGLSFLLSGREKFMGFGSMLFWPSEYSDDMEGDLGGAKTGENGLLGMFKLLLEEGFLSER